MSRRPAVLSTVLLVLALGVGGCGPFDKGADARDAAETLVDGLASGDLGKVVFTEDAAGAQKEYVTLRAPLKDAETEVTLDQVTRSGDEATARIAWTVDLDGHPWSHTTKAVLRKQGDDWAVVWKPSIVEKSLTEGRRLRISRVQPERGDILGADDQPIVTPRPVVRFGIDKQQVVGSNGVAVASARRLAELVGIEPGPFARQVRTAGPRAFVQAIVLRRPEVTQRLLAGVDRINGGGAITDELPLAPSKDFAAAILGTVGPATAEAIKKAGGRLRIGDDTGLSGLQQRYDEQLSGTRGVRVSVLPPAPEEASDLTDSPENEPRVVFEAAAVKGKDLRTTLDPRLEQKAQDLLASVGPASALVAIRPSTGQIVAAASGPGSNGYNTATFGQYAPGSTFKVISSLALLRSGLTPAAPVTCPAEVIVNGKRFTNYSDYPASGRGRISLTRAVANSCNTAFIGQRARIKGTALADAAAALGVGIDHDLGFPAYFGQVKPPASQTEAAADLIGQGRILASPMAMAAVAASVVRGATVLPVLLPDATAPAGPQPREPLTGAEASQLRGLMHAVVEEGSGSFLRALQPPDVLAKTGTAEYGRTPPLPTHAWMIGAQGDLAVAVFVATGQSGSRTAGPILEAFLRAANSGG